MLLVVIDTNELLKMAAERKRSPLFVAWRAGRFELVMSEDMLSELQDAAAKPKVLRFLPEDTGRQFVTFVSKWATFVPLAIDFPHCRDARDDVVIATAVAARAQFIVTADNDLHDLPLVACLRDEWNIRVVYPAEFLAALQP